MPSAKTMVDRNHMTPMQKTIAYSAIIVGILAVFSAFGTAIHIANYVFTLPVGVCPLDGQWGSWGSWSTCGSNCQKSKYRNCTNPAPGNGGNYCPGSGQVNSSCTGGLCMQINGSWGLWSSWSSCGSNCQKSRSRSCNNPAPANGGNTCPGSGQESSSCIGGLCAPRDGKWGSWSSWTSCGSNCRKSRSRSCDNPAPAHGGDTCSGFGQESSSCTGGLCPGNGN